MTGPRSPFWEPQIESRTVKWPRKLALRASQTALEHLSQAATQRFLFGRLGELDRPALRLLLQHLEHPLAVFIAIRLRLEGRLELWASPDFVDGWLSRPTHSCGEFEVCWRGVSDSRVQALEVVEVDVVAHRSGDLSFRL